MDKQKIQEIRSKRAELSKQILSLKGKIAKLSPGVPDITSDSKIFEHRMHSISFGIAAALSTTIGVLLSLFSSLPLIGLTTLPVVVASILGIVLNEKEIKKLKKKQKQFEIKSSPELNKKEKELEKLEAYDHELYVQLTQELSKSNKPTKTYEKYKLATDNNSWIIDEHEPNIEL